LSNRQTEKRLTFRRKRLRPPLRGRAAWAHNFNTDSSISATFRCFPPLRRQRRGASARQRAGVSRRGSKMAEPSVVRSSAASNAAKARRSTWTAGPCDATFVD